MSSDASNQALAPQGWNDPQWISRLDDVLAMWKVRKARETSWNNAEILWHIRSVQLLRNKFLRTLDRLTGFAGRGLLISIDH